MVNAKAPLAATVGWTDLDHKAVDTVRVLAADGRALRSGRRGRTRLVRWAGQSHAVLSDRRLVVLGRCHATHRPS